MLKYKKGRKLITVICDFCGQEYEKPITEYNRNKSLNRHSFCSRTCSVKFGNKNVPRKRSYEHLKLYQRKINPFLFYLRTIRKRYKEINITIEDLIEQWNKQEGVCPYSGIKLLLASSRNTNINPIYRASLDRVDSNKGYIKGNIQFTSTSINYMKNDMSHEDTIKLCKLITKNYVYTFV